MSLKSTEIEKQFPLYKQAERPIQQRVEDLLRRMTLEEKAAQMIGIWNEMADTLVDESGNFDAQKAKKAFKEGHGLGQVGRPSTAGPGHDARGQAVLTNKIQQFFIEESRLGIPVIFHEECLHGQAAKDGTSFPQPIALGASFNPDLVEALYTMTAKEARVRGAHQALTPVVDVARDPRWGRVEETFGEDPFLVAQMGIAAVRGFQGDAQFNTKDRVIATLKHFAAHGQPESGQNCAPVNVSERVLRETFLYPFKEAIQQGGAISVMASYNEIDGLPSHANRWLLRHVLREEWGFDGFVVSDYYAIWELSDRPDTHGHHVAANKEEACALAVKAGVNIELPEPDCYLHIVDLVKAGVLDESDLDDLVAPMLRWKFELGLFEDPYVDPDVAEAVVGADEHNALALQAAHESVTLLKNENSILPLDPTKPQTIAVVGPNAHRSLLGGYSGTPKYEITVLEGIRDAVGEDVLVVYSEGCKITLGGSWEGDEVLPSDEQEDYRQIQEASETVKDADIIVLAIGGNEQTSRESWALNHMGDRTSIDLFGRQQALFDAMVATGKPVIVLLFNGRPLSVTSVSEDAHALLECWYIGQETGRAVADILFGTFNPGGKLPISIPRSAGHIPAYYNYKPSARRGYLFDEVSPLFPFGYGLSYTSFSITDIQLEKATIGIDESTSISCRIKNTGQRTGSEVVQLYIRDRVSSVTRPVKELKAFKRVNLSPGEVKTVSFEVSPASLAFYDAEMNYTVEPGEFNLMLGTSSRDEDLHMSTLTVAH